MVGHQLANDERDQAEYAEPGEDSNVVGREPVFALAGIEQDLQRADAEREKSDAPEIDSALAALDVVRIEDEAVHEE